MLHPSHVVLLRAHVKLQLSELLIARLLKLAELKDELLVALRLVTEVGFELGYAPFLFIFSLGEIFNLALVQIGQVLLHVLQFLRLTVLQLLHFTTVLRLELRLDIVIGRENPIHVLLRLFLGVEKAELRPIDLILEPCNLFLQVRVLSAQEVFVLVEKINLAAKAFVVPLTVSLALLAPTQLLIDLFLLALQLTELVLELPVLFILSVELATLLVEESVLGVQLLVVGLKVQIASFQSSHSSIRLLFDFLELRAQC